MLLLFKKNFSTSSTIKWFYKKFLEIFIYPSVWVSAGLASLTIYTQDVLNLPADWRPPLLIFSASLVFYNLDRIFDSYVQEIPDRKVQSFFRNKLVFLLLLLAILVTLTLLFFAPQQVRLVSLGGLVPLLYGMPLFPLQLGQEENRWYRLKDIPGTKAWIVAGTLTYAVVAVPLAYANAGLDRSAILISLFLFIFIGTNSHLFDLRDVRSDFNKGVLTLPLIIGIKETRLLFTALNLLVLLGAIWYWVSELAILSPLTIGLATLINIAIVWLPTPETPRNIYNIWIDGCLFLPILLNI